MNSDVQFTFLNLTDRFPRAFQTFLLTKKENPFAKVRDPLVHAFVRKVHGWDLRLFAFAFPFFVDMMPIHSYASTINVDIPMAWFTAVCTSIPPTTVEYFSVQDFIDPTNDYLDSQRVIQYFDYYRVAGPLGEELAALFDPAFLWKQKKKAIAVALSRAESEGRVPFSIQDVVRLDMRNDPDITFPGKETRADSKLADECWRKTVSHRFQKVSWERNIDMTPWMINPHTNAAFVFYAAVKRIQEPVDSQWSPETIQDLDEIHAWLIQTDVPVDMRQIFQPSFLLAAKHQAQQQTVQEPLSVVHMAESNSRRKKKKKSSRRSRK